MFVKGGQKNHELLTTSQMDSMTIDDQKVYERKYFNDRKSPRLHVHDVRNKILDAIEVQRIVIIKGETGCGKTTQIPQFILDSAIEKNQPCNIVVTQPRRIAAITVAKRVAFERKRPLGTLVGYQIGLDKKGNEDTRILYVTTGVLLQKLIANKNLDEFTHYIVDEIHERNQDMDFLLIVLRRFLNLQSKGEAKLIVMSATMDVDKLKKYLVMNYNDVFKPPIIDITHDTQFVVRKFFLEDLCTGRNKIKEAMTLCPFELDVPQITDSVYKTAARIIQELDNVDQNDADNDEVLGKRPAVLVFLPGLHEIETMEKILKEMSSPEQYNSFWVKPLHSSITAEEQQAVFMNPPKSKRKIILSTNIAESSLTVTDIKYVIDFCLTKSLVTDPVTGCTCLELDWAPKSNLKQRAGRVGRIASGRVYRMISSEFYYNELPEEAVPEIQRCPLETLVLKAKLLDMGPPRMVLDLAMDPPNLENLIQAVAYLKQIGALLLYVGDEYNNSDGDLTSLGKIIAHLPLDVRLGKLVFLGFMFGVPEECIIMACAMATKNIFCTPYGKYLEAYESKLWWADSTRSDCFAFLNAYKGWRQLTSNRDVRASEEHEFATCYFLQMKALKELADLEEDVKRRLEHHNFYTNNNRSKYADSTDDELFFLKLAIAGAFYPNYFVRASAGTQDEERQAFNALGGHDPLCTVYLMGLPFNQPTVIYKKIIKKQFRRITERLNVNVDNGSKAYVTFRSTVSQVTKGQIPGRIEMAVYRAVKMRQANVKVSIPFIKHDEATKIYKKCMNQKRGAADDDVNPELRRILNKLVWPWQTDGIKKHKEILEIKISHIESPQRFWIQSSLKNSEIALMKLNAVLNAPASNNCLIRLPTNADLAIGSLYVATSGDGLFYRCRIVEKNFERRGDAAEYTYTVFFVDYGNSRERLRADEIYDVDRTIKEQFFIEKLPRFAIECSLVKIQPKSKKFNDNPSQNCWHNRATNTFRKLFESSSSIAKVYSVVNDVLRVKVVTPHEIDNEYTWKNTINYKLIADGYAEKANEDYISLCKRDDLKKFISLPENNEKIRKYYAEDEEDSEILSEKKDFANTSCFIDIDDLELPENIDNTTETILKGPYSPLEMEVSSMTGDKTGKRVNIERDSVNSVLLDTDPSDPKEKMLVAAFVGVNHTKDHIILRHTTMMPDVRALPMLCSLLFAPMVELRVNPSFTRYTGAICGLGYDRKTKRSLFPESDLSVLFDCEITEKELQLINKLRFRMNCIVHPTDKLSTKELIDCRGRLRDGLKELFFQNNLELQPTYHSTKPYNWGLIDVGRLKNPLSGEGAKHPAEDFYSVYRMIWAVQRTGNADKELQELLSNLKMLEEFSEGGSSRNTIECPLCKISLSDAASAKMHLKTAIHRVRSKRYHQ